MSTTRLLSPSAATSPNLRNFPRSFPGDHAPVEREDDRDRLYQDFQPLVRRLLRQYGDTAEQRQDLSGEIYFLFCKLLTAFDPNRGVPLRPYLVRGLTAAVYTHVRSSRRHRRREVSLEALIEQADPSEVVDPSTAWNDHIVMQDVLKSLPDAIARLPKRQRQVVIWRYYESRTFEDIAEQLQIRPATARSLLRHGINALRRIVTPPEM